MKKTYCVFAIDINEKDSNWSLGFLKSEFTTIEDAEKECEKLIDCSSRFTIIPLYTKIC